MRLLGHRLARIVQEVRIGALAAAADAAAQLVQLAQAEAVGMVHDQRVRVRDIQAGLDDRGAYEHVDVAVPEVADDLVELLLPHLAVGGADLGFGHELLDPGGHAGDVGHAVVHVKHLAAAQQLATDRRGDLRVLVGAHVGEHRQAVLRRGGERGHLADAGHRHLQRARDRRGGQGEHVHVGAQRLERLLVFDAEALLLVDDDQAQVLELDLGVEQLVRADDHVHGAVLKPLDRVVDVLGGLEAAHRPDGDGEALVALREGLVMLLDEQRGRHEHGHLLGVLHGLERGAHGDLGFAETHVAADQAVHRDRLLHIGLDLVDGGQLVGGLLVRERVLQLLLPRGVGAERETGRALAGRIQLDQVLGDLMDVLAGLGLGGRPVGAAQFVEFRGLRADVLADLVELVGGNEQLVRRGAAFARRIFDDQVFARGLRVRRADGTLAHLDEPADAMLLVHHIVAGFQLHQVDGLAAALRGLGLGRGASAARQVAFGQQRDAGGRVDESVKGLRTDRIEPGDAGLVDRALETGERAVRGGGHRHIQPRVEQPLDARGGTGLVATVFGRRVRGEPHPPRQAVVHAEIGQTPDVMLGECQRGDRLMEIEEAGLIEADRRAGAMPGRGDMPAGGEELVRRLHQVLGRTFQLLRVGQHDHRPLGQHASHRFHVVDQRGQQRFHALHRNRIGDRLQHVLGVGDLADQAAGAVADRVGQLHFTAGRGPDRPQPVAVGPLVGRMELADRVDLVSEELDAHRMRRRRREHVEQAATDGELAAVHHQIDTGVRVLHQPGGGLLQRQLLVHRENQRCHVAQSGDHRLDQRTHRHHQDADRSEHRTAGFGMPQAAEHGHTAGHRVGAGRQPFVRQRLPSLQLGDVARVAVVPGTQRIHRLLGLTAGGDDVDDRMTFGHGRRQCGTDAVGCAHDDAGGHIAFRGFDLVVDEPAETLVLVQRLQQAGQRSVHQLVHQRVGVFSGH